jgi:hypothetical protein
VTAEVPTIDWSQPLTRADARGWVAAALDWSHENELAFNVQITPELRREMLTYALDRAEVVRLEWVKMRSTRPAVDRLRVLGTVGLLKSTLVEMMITTPEE